MEFTLHCRLSTKRVFVAFDRGYSKIAVVAAEANKAIPMREITLNTRLVPFLRMTDIADRKVEMLCPEEWDHCEGLISA